MSVDEITFEAEEGMEKAVEFMMHEFNSIRTGKAASACRSPTTRAASCAIR